MILPVLTKVPVFLGDARLFNENLPVLACWARG